MKHRNILAMGPLVSSIKKIEECEGNIVNFLFIIIILFSISYSSSSVKCILRHLLDIMVFPELTEVTHTAVILEELPYFRISSNHSIGAIIKTDF